MKAILSHSSRRFGFDGWALRVRGALKPLGWLAMQHHPDRGGSSEAMARINAARDQGMDQYQ